MADITIKFKVNSNKFINLHPQTNPCIVKACHLRVWGPLILTECLQVEGVLCCSRLQLHQAKVLVIRNMECFSSRLPLLKFAVMRVTGLASSSLFTL